MPLADPLGVVGEVFKTLHQSLVPELAPAEVVTRVAQITGWPGVALFAPCAEGAQLCVMAAAGPLAPPPDARAPMQGNLLGEVWQAGVLKLLSTAPPEAVFWPDAPALAGALLLPLKLGERVQLLLLIASDTPGACDGEMQRVAEVLGEALLIALRNARLYTALQGEVAERQRMENRFWGSLHKTETLYRIGRTLNAPYFSDSVLLDVTNQIAAALHAGQVVLASLDSHNHRVQHFIVGGAGAEQVAPLSYDEVLAGLTGRVIREGLPVLLLRDAAQSRAAEHGLYWYKGLYTGAMAAAPLFAHGQGFGVLLAVNPPDRPDFAQADLNLLMAIAGQVATAIQSAQLFQAVTEERSRLRALIQSSRDGVILLGLNMHVLVINRPALDLLKLPGEPDEWVDQWFWDALSRLYEHSPQAVDVILSEVRRVQEGDERPGEGEMQVGPRIVHWLNLPVLGVERAAGRLFVLQDVTEARLLERFREDLTHTMVHDLRNPLSGIYAGLRLLAADYDSAATPSHRRILEAAQSSVQRMLRLVGAILDINRLESGKMPLNLAVFDFAALLDDVLTVQNAIAVERQLTLRKEIPPDLPRVWADKDLVERVLQNLLGNALKFTPAGGTVSVILTALGTPACKLQVAVSDTGQGVPEEVRQRLFEKFVAGSQRERGSGLGLAFCRMALEAHGERVWLVETSERGATFAFTLPLSDCE